MATNLDFGMDYARNAAAYLENGNYVKAGIFEIGAALEVVLDLGVAYYGAGIFGGVVEGAKTALATGSLIQGYIQAERQVNQFTEQFKADVSNTWNAVTAPVINTWNSATTTVTAVANKGVEGSTNSSWYNADGSINYPPNNGAVAGTEVNMTLKSGESLGRYGNIGPKSNFVTQTGADASKLSLPPNTDPAIYKEFNVIKDIPETIQAEIAPWVVLTVVVYSMSFQNQFYN